MKILYLGDIGAGQTSLMRMRALTRLGHDVKGVNTVEPWRQASWLQRQLQRRLNHGSVVDSINRSVVAAAKAFRPDLIWGCKQEFLRKETIEEFRKLGAKSVHFTPDPYFTLAWKRTRVMDETFQSFDAIVYCKAYERENYESLNCPVIYMPLGYCDEVHRPIKSLDLKWICTIGFLGGWEPRREHLLHKVAVSGVDLKIWGGYWEFLKDGKRTLRRRIIMRQLAGGESFTVHRNPLLASALQGGEVYGEDYAKALSGTRVGLGFLRKVCPDQHTTRTFEIPACGSMLLADRTEEHLQFFDEGKDAEFFADEEELIDKVNFYNINERARKKIASAGYDRCTAGRYAYIHRMADALASIMKVLK
jgi:spore maturation protein CgeB